MNQATHRADLISSLLRHCIGYLFSLRACGWTMPLIRKMTCVLMYVKSDGRLDLMPQKVF